MSCTQKILARRLRKARFERDFSTDDLAADANVSKSVIEYCETGKRNPQINTIEKIAKALNMNPAYLVGWINESEVTE